MKTTAQKRDYADAARALAERYAGEAPAAVARFPTGLMHYVFEATFVERAPLVLRLTDPAYRQMSRDAAMLSRRLRPLGVALPALLEDGTEAEIPYAILERLNGTDLGAVIGALSEPQLRAIAKAVARMQQAVAATPSAGRFGYAADPAAAPFERWSDVVEANVVRSCKRISAAGLFEVSLVEEVARLAVAHRGAMDAVAATPFLHDTTTKNVIVAPDGSLSGIVDVDDLCFGDPRHVIALTSASLLNLGLPPVYTDAWMAEAGFAQDALFWLYVAAFTADFMGEHGQVFNGNQRPSHAEDRARLVQQLDFALERARR